MPACGICGGDAPRQPEVTEDGRCDQCQRRIVLEEDLGKTKCGLCGGEAPRQPVIKDDGACDMCGKKIVLKE